MRIGAVSYRCRNKDIDFNLSQIERALKETEGKVDLLCFPEAFLQGFDSLCWDYKIDKQIACTQDGEAIGRLKDLSLEYGVALLTGYIEREKEKIYSSCIAIDKGEIVHNYRRISRGWKEFDQTDDHYDEGTDTSCFVLNDTRISLALCGDLWDQPERFEKGNLLLWPVFLSFSLKMWEESELKEYTKHASSICDYTLMFNPIDPDTGSHGGSFCFHDEKILDRIAFDEEGVLIWQAV